ncbi:hypothetical protein GCM10023176_37630 [Micromonospora coerulea]|uniref:STAS domain-containing protein n=1 Tax=Micromonospora coerulea TaxID=47856 RepID=A0ABP8SQX8_9ACTN
MSDHLLSFGDRHLPTGSASLRPDEAVMWLTSTADGPTKQVKVCGEVDMSNAHLLVELVETLTRTPPPRVAVDLSEVTYFGAHGISALLQARALLTDRGGQLTVRDPSPIVLRIVTVAGVRHELGLADLSTHAEHRSTLPPR